MVWAMAVIWEAMVHGTTKANQIRLGGGVMLHPLNFNTWLFDSLQKLKHYELIIKPAVILCRGPVFEVPSQERGCFPPSSPLSYF